MCRAFRRDGRSQRGARLLQQTTLPIPCGDQSRRLYVHIQCELALCESNFDDVKACDLFEAAVRSSINLLGRTDKTTIQLRLDFATFLESSSRYSGALNVLLALRVESKDSLHPWREFITQMEERLRYKKVKKRRRERPMLAEQNLTEDDSAAGETVLSSPCIVPDCQWPPNCSLNLAILAI